MEIFYSLNGKDVNQKPLRNPGNFLSESYQQSVTGNHVTGNLEFHLYY